MALTDQISLDPVFGWYVLIPLGLIMLASLWLTLTSEGISKRARTTLVALRLGALCILLLGWLRPGFVSEQTSETPGAIAVLMDRSQSMTLPSSLKGKSRWEVQADLWNTIERTTDLSIGESKIIPYFFDSTSTIALSDDSSALSKVFAKPPTGRVTDLGRSLSELSKLQIDPPLRGIVLIGDATQTAVPATIDPALIARQMAQLDQPIYMVGLGSRGDDSQLKDVGIEGLPEHFSAFVKKELGVRMVINAKGMQNQPIQLKLTLRASGKPDQVVGSREIFAARPSQLLPQDFQIEMPEAGEYLLEAEVSVDAKDQIPSNNRAISFVTVREGGARILYLEGQPRQEQLFLKRALNESLDFDVQYAWLEERDVARSPSRTADRISYRDYDAIVIGDLDASALSRQAQQAIALEVKLGAGILFLGGYHSFEAGGYGKPQCALEPLFPTRMGRRSQPYDQPIDSGFHIQGNVQLLPTRPHPITNLLPDEQDNVRLWRNLKPMQGMNRLGKIKQQPGVQVLLESPRGDPGLVTGQYSKGRVLAFAADSTWQWWLSGQKRVSQQFWRQAILWLVRRDTLTEGFKLDLETRRMLVDETPDLSIQWFGGTENKSMPEDVRIELSREGRVLHRIPTSKENANTLAGKLSGLGQPGLYRAALSATGSDGKEYQSDIAFIVRDESRELARPDPDWQMMKSIVAANQAAGGRQVLPDQIAQVLKILQTRQEATQVTTIEMRRLGDAAWDSWTYLVLFCLLICTEWVLRKSWQLP